MNADVVPEIDFPALANHAADTQGRGQGVLQRARVKHGNELIVTDSGRRPIGPFIKNQRGRFFIDLSQFQSALRNVKIRVDLDLYPTGANIADDANGVPGRSQIGMPRFQFQIAAIG